MARQWAPNQATRSTRLPRRQGFRSPASASRITSLPSVPADSVSVKLTGNQGLPPPARLRLDLTWLSEPRATVSGGIATISLNCICLNSLRGVGHRGHCANWHSHAASIEYDIPLGLTVHALPCGMTRIRSLSSTTRPASPAHAVCGPAMKFKGLMP